jgi:hypothetical protein
MASEQVGAGLDAALDELYGADPAEFVVTRKRLARALRDAGDAGAARKLEAARRPTKSARALNVLARHNPGVVSELWERSDELRAAQAEALAGHPGTQRDAIRAQRLALAAAADAAVALVEGSGEAARAEILSTLQAAAADPDLAPIVAAGRLDRCDVVATGFPADLGPDVLPPRDELAARRSLRTPPEAPKPQGPAPRERAGARAEERRRERERQVVEARQRAADELAEAEVAWEAASTDAERSLTRVAELEVRVDALRVDLDAARLELRAARDRVAATARALKRRSEDVARRRAEIDRS